MTRGELRQRPALGDHDREHAQRRDDAVAGRRVVEEDEVPRLLAAEVVAARAHLLDDVAIADGRAHERAARAASARSSPRFDITVATSVRPGSASRASMRVPNMAMTWSPSTTVPVSSARMTRSASPSSATPRCAPTRRTSAAMSSGWSAPHSSLMFLPSGWTPSAMTSAPSSSNTRGATWYAAPFAQSTTILRPSSVRSVGNAYLKNTT